MGVIIVLFILVAVSIYLYQQNHSLERSYYRLRVPHAHQQLTGTKIVHLSDLHLPNAGASLSTIVQGVKEEQPSVIVITGDIIHASIDELPEKELTTFGKELSSIAPVYAVTGNHDLGAAQMEKWNAILSASGIQPLHDESVWLSLKEGGLCMMGLSEKNQLSSTSKTRLKHLSVPEGKETQFKILLAHHPEHFEDYVKNPEKAPDLVLAGHTHGGQVILPIVGGLYAPGQGKLPIYDYGIFMSARDPSKRLIISRGLGNSTFPFRINNRPEMVVVQLES